MGIEVDAVEAVEADVDEVMPVTPDVTDADAPQTIEQMFAAPPKASEKKKQDRIDFGKSGVHFQLTDAGNADRLVAEHGDDIRYVNDEKGWRIFDGISWKPDTTSEISRLAKSTVRNIGIPAFLPSDMVRDDRKLLTEWSFACESRSRLENMVVLASREAKVSTNSIEFDKSPWLFNCSNGTYDLEVNKFREARRSDLLSKRSPVVYDSKATCPQWERFLARILPAEATRRFLQASFGYTLSGHNWEKHLWFFIGSGDNGKTVCLETIRYIFGDYAVGMNFSSLMPREGQGPSSDIARLQGCRFASASESDQGQRLSTSVLKRHTGADKITACQKYQKEIEFDPTHKIFLVTNNPPVLPAEDEAVWRRLLKVAFDVQVPKEEQDKLLSEKLKAEAAGILNWMIAGWGIYRADGGLTVPVEVQEETDRYRDASDEVKEFLDATVIPGSQDVGSTELYQAFKYWFQTSHNQRQQPMSQIRFSKRLKALGYQIEARRDGRVVCNIGRMRVDDSLGW